MKKKRENNAILSQYKWQGLLLISLGLPLLLHFVFPGLYGPSVQAFGCGILWTASITLVIWSGCEIIERVLNRHISWKKNPGRRIIIQFFCVILFSFLVSILAYMLEPHEQHKAFEHFVLSTVITVSITVLINMIGLSRFFFQEWKNSIRENEELKKENIQSQFESLKNQVNPHFLFNCLNTLSGLIEEKPANAVDFVGNMAQVYRYLLIQNNNYTAILKDEIDFLESYLFLNKVRFEKALQFTINISEEASQKKLANLSMQILVENAIKHNVIMESKPLFIEIFDENNYLVVRNNLQKKEAVSSTGTGLANITHRYALLAQGKEVIISEDEKYFTIKIPLL